MNMNYLFCTSCTGCVQIYNDIQQVHTGYKREMRTFYMTKSQMIYQDNPKCAYVF